MEERNTRQELGSKETEKLLEDAEQQNGTDDRAQHSMKDSGTVCWDDSTEGSVASTPKSGSPFTSLLARQRSDNGSKSLSFLRCFYNRDEKFEHFTPFAIVLLIVLLLVYVLNQADRLVLPVVIPNGLRCNVGKDQCATENTTNNATNSSGSKGDCIVFNDDQQGLLTG